MKSLLKKIVPKFIFTWYYYCLALIGAIIYRFPSQKIIVIGITGTKGKSTSAYLAGKILQEAGFKTGWISSLSICDGTKEIANPYHMTMPGRFFIQKTLSQFVKNKCDAAIIETTSEGIKQFRHKFINFDTLLFTNIAPEHIEAHGSFKKYKKTKLLIFRTLHTLQKKYIDSKKIPKTIIANLDDQNTKCFLEPAADVKIGYGIARGMRDKEKGIRLEGKECHPEGTKDPVVLCTNFWDPSFPQDDREARNNNQSILIATNIKTDKNISSFIIDNTKFNLKLLGTFNIYNSLAAIAIASTFDINLETAAKVLEKIAVIHGRMEKIRISQKQNFEVFIDLAHTPGSYQEIFSFVKNELKPKNIISVLGSAGGGRDKWKRPEMGQIAGAYSSYIILTDEDPYNENPKTILQDIAKGVKKETKNYEIIHDRKSAIKKALHMAGTGDIVLILGKGTEATMKYKNKTIEWDEKKVVEDELRQLSC